tara:strand:+ start:209 stop:460 length:252 start_codon:yes stop_codon:yes gene_type:complete
MTEYEYKNDPNFYLTMAGGCSALVCCLVCIAKNWDNPPEWLAQRMQPKWNKTYGTTENSKVKTSPTIIVNKQYDNDEKGWQIV